MMMMKDLEKCCVRKIVTYLLKQMQHHDNKKATVYPHLTFQNIILNPPAKKMIFSSGAFEISRCDFASCVVVNAAVLCRARPHNIFVFLQ